MMRIIKIFNTKAFLKEIINSNPKSIFINIDTYLNIIKVEKIPESVKVYILSDLPFDYVIISEQNNFYSFFLDLLYKLWYNYNIKGKEGILNEF